MNPILVSIGSFDIAWYSVLILIGMIIAYFGVSREADRFKIDKNFLTNVIFWAVIFGIIGARIYFVAFSWNYYRYNLSEIYKVWNGGLAIHGAILFGAAAVLIYCKKNKISFLKILDIFVPFMLLAQAIGRWGNFFNSEAYGIATTYAKLKSMLIPEVIINGMRINGSYYLPMFYFESIWCVLGVILLLIIRRFKKIKKGQTTCVYLMWYSIGRFFIEMYRTDSLLIGNIRMAQVISIILFAVGAIFFVVKLKDKNPKSLYNLSDKAK